MTCILTATKQVIAKAWLANTLSLEAIKAKTHWMLMNDKLTAKLTDIMHTFHKTWDPWISKYTPSYRKKEK